ncbi:MAG TPA: P1 family peptidase, partial [Paracoccus sp. (in: a-proteobacteria)]|nr:P1 family peptidase [Paracoccus sp. (in: a-proteobacteria)]
MAKRRARDLGLEVPGTPGPLNAITDIPGVKVGLTTLIEGQGPLVVGEGPVRTGVTAILPRGHDDRLIPVWAGIYALNGNGEMTGSHWIRDGGYFLGPILITNTHSVGMAHHAATGWMIDRYPEIKAEHVWAMPVVASMTVWIWVFDWRRGIVNWALTQLGLDFTNHNWLEQPLSFYFVATVIVVWMSVPFVAFSVYAGLTQISDEVMEAAALDGASARQRFFAITLPMIRPVLMIVALLQVIWDLRVFAQIKMLQDDGAPTASTDLLGTYI